MVTPGTPEPPPGKANNMEVIVKHLNDLNICNIES